MPDVRESNREPLEDIEALLRSAQDYVRPSEDLRPRVLEAARTLHATKFGALPVLRDGRLVGIVTDNDLLRCLSDLLEQGG